MPPNKTLYIRDEDAPIWERAEQAAGVSRQSLSQLVATALRRYLPTIHTPADEMEDIRVRVGDRVPPVHRIIGEDGRVKYGPPAHTPANYPRGEAFTGHWLVPPGPDARSATSQPDGSHHAVALTRRGQIAVYHYHPEALAPAGLTAFPSLEEATLPADIKEKAAEALGEQHTTWRDI